MNIIEIRNLSKSFGDKKVLNDISFDVKKGEIYGIVGKNGAGKSTLLKCILGLIPSYDGKISGESNGKVDLKDVGSILEEPVFFGNLTGYENLLYYSRCFGIKDKKEIKGTIIPNSWKVCIYLVFINVILRLFLGLINKHIV